MNWRDLFRRWPAVSYFILVFLISWGGVIAFGLGGFRRGVEPGLADMMPMVVAMLSAPLATGIAMTAITDGRDGLRDLWRRFANWRVSGRWYLALLIFPALILAVQIPLSIWFNKGLSPIFNPVGIVGGLMAGLQEEVGWTGFAYPKLRARSSVVRASLVLGLIHAAWHAPADFLGNFNSMRQDWLPYFAGFFIFIVALRVIIAWIYENTHSLLLAQLAHAFSTGFLGILVPTANSGELWPAFYAVYSVALCLVAALIVLRSRGRVIRLKPTLV